MTIARAIEVPADIPLAAGAVDCHVAPLDVKTLPDVLGATTCTAEVPLPKITLLAVIEVAPVPPLADKRNGRDHQCDKSTAHTADRDHG